MTQTSGFWTTNGTGDGVGSGYALSALSTFFNAVFLDDETAQGPLLGYLNALAVSGSASPVTVATGAAVVRGLWYVNDAAATVAVPTPSGATRIDRIVLEVSYSAQTVRVVRVAGSEGGAAPALTQSAGVTWQISLARVSITTGGVITVTDERQYAVFNTQVKTANLAADAVTGAKLADDSVDSEHYVDASIDTQHIGDLQITTALLAADAVTGAKLADDSVDSEHYVDASIDTAHIGLLQITTALLAADAVDGDKVGARVAQVHRRQGGHATNWNVAGTTTYTPGAVRIQCGMVDWTGSAASSGSLAITFPVAFSAAPLALVQHHFGYNVQVVITNTTTTTVNLNWWSSSGNLTVVTINWLAIGPE